jgi:hypothetical protein
MKKLFLYLIIIIGGLTSFVNVMKNFEYTKVFYASFYPDKYFYKDTLITNEVTNPSSSGPNKTYYRFIGYSQFDSTKIGVELSFSMVEDENNSFNRGKIPIWRSNITKMVWYRREDNVFPKPFSIYMIDYWLGTIMSILFLPCLLYLIYLKKFKK